MLANTNELKNSNFGRKTYIYCTLYCAYIVPYMAFFFFLNALKCYCIPSVPLKKKMLMDFGSMLLSTHRRHCQTSKKSNKSTDIFLAV